MRRGIRVANFQRRSGKEEQYGEGAKSAMHQGQGLAGEAGEFLIGNDLRVTRLGFGAMRITGNGIWGEPQIELGLSGCCAGLSNWESISSTPRTPMVGRE
jgi:hypothetical protein